MPISHAPNRISTRILKTNALPVIKGNSWEFAIIKGIKRDAIIPVTNTD
jgi:hypothetical protein